MLLTKAKAVHYQSMKTGEWILGGDTVDELYEYKNLTVDELYEYKSPSLQMLTKT